jgi:hypothetical protein
MGVNAMKHHDPLRPVGKCKGCCLNLKKQCLARLAPKAQWNKGRCRSYDDQALLARLLSQPQPSGAKLARQVRRAKAIEKAGQPHYNGALDPGKLAGRGIIASRQA